MNNEFKNIVRMCPNCKSTDYTTETDSRYGNVATGNRRCLSCGRLFVENSEDKDRYDRFEYAISIIPINETKAIEILEKLADEGYPLACRQLGSQYAPFEKFGFTKRDVEKSKYWFERGIELKDARCANSMGLLYWSGNGVKKDIDKAILYSELAIDLCTADDADLLNVITKNIDAYRKELEILPSKELYKKRKTNKLICYAIFVLTMILAACFLINDLEVYTLSFILPVFFLVFFIAWLVYVYCISE